MTYTIFKRTIKGDGITIQKIELNTLITNIKQGVYDTEVARYRKVFLELSKPEESLKYKSMAQICPVCQWRRNKSKEQVFEHYNGVSVLKIVDLGTSLELEKAKKAASLMPQTILAVAGADGHSVVVLTLSTLPNGSLPETQDEAIRHAAKAYATAVMSLQPLTEFQVEVLPPTLDSSFAVTTDATPYYNENATPFIVELPSAIDLKMLQENSGVVKPLKNLKPGPVTYHTNTTIFNSAYMSALEAIEWKPGDKHEQLLVRVAKECCKLGMGEEEVTRRLSFRFDDMLIEDIRSTVRTVYEELEGTKISGFMTKHQCVAFRLREFLNRRYDIRFNEVLQMTEYREKNSLWFDYHELGRRELNTIHHEALLEGIEPTFGEIDELVHSTVVKMYNPIENYLNNLPAWDGKDRIAELASRVPTDNPHWLRLFRQWLLSMVAHWMNGDEMHANSTAPILIGAQGYRKSTFCRMLLPPELQMFYTDSIDFRSNIEAERCLSRFLLVNIDEFDQLSEKQFAFVKHLFQKPASNIRRMYSEAIGRQRRYASFVGTTNSEEVLRDPTGNRRYLCVFVNGVIATESPVNYGQLYAQLVHLINTGERYWLNDEDEALIKQMNVQFEMTSALEELLLTAFTKPAGNDDGEWMRLTSVMEVIQKMPGFNRRRDNDLQQLGKMLSKIGFKKRRMKNGVEYMLKQK